MVSFMVPGLAFLYSGLSRRKSARMLPSLSDQFISHHYTSLSHLGRRSEQRRRDSPVVYLGLLSCVLVDSNKWLHWKPKKLWAHEGRG
jgi:hypothetical protein